MPINDGKYVVPAWQDRSPPAIDAAEMTAIGQSIVTNQNGVAQNTQNVSTLQQQMSTANQNIASLQQFQTTATGQIANLTNNYLPKSGGTMTGAITLPGNPSGALQAVPKQYADARGWTLITSGALQFGDISGSTGAKGYTNGLILNSITDKYEELAVKVSFRTFRFSSETGEDAANPLRLSVYLKNFAGMSNYLLSNSDATILYGYWIERYNPEFTFDVLLVYRKRALLVMSANQTQYKVPIFINASKAESFSGTSIREVSAITDGTELQLYVSGFSSGTHTASGTIIMSVYGR